MREYEAEIAAQEAEIKEMEQIAKTLQKQLEEANGTKRNMMVGCLHGRLRPIHAYLTIMETVCIRH